MVFLWCFCDVLFVLTRGGSKNGKIFFFLILWDLLFEKKKLFLLSVFELPFVGSPEDTYYGGRDKEKQSLLRSGVYKSIKKRKFIQIVLLFLKPRPRLSLHASKIVFFNF